jgi:hypothetical protein
MCDHNCSWCQIGMATSMLCREKSTIIIKAQAAEFETQVAEPIVKTADPAAPVVSTTPK